MPGTKSSSVAAPAAAAPVAEGDFDIELSGSSLAVEPELPIESLPPQTPIEEPVAAEPIEAPVATAVEAGRSAAESLLSNDTGTQEFPATHLVSGVAQRRAAGYLNRLSD